MFVAVVNLTLIDLPGLTKVAVGEFSVFMFLHFLEDLYISSVKTDVTEITCLGYLQRVSRTASSWILRTWFVPLLRRYAI